MTSEEAVYLHSVGEVKGHVNKLHCKVKGHGKRVTWSHLVPEISLFIFITPDYYSDDDDDVSLSK